LPLPPRTAPALPLLQASAAEARLLLQLCHRQQHLQLLPLAQETAKPTNDLFSSTFGQKFLAMLHTAF